MTNAQGKFSVATRVLLITIGASVLVGLVVGMLLVLAAQRSATREAERVTRAVSTSVADQPSVGVALAGGAGSATEHLQPVVEQIIEDTNIDFVTIMFLDGTIVTNRDLGLIGKQYPGTIPSSPEPLTEVYNGVDGESIRTIVPVLHFGSHVGWVSAGLSEESVGANLLARLPPAMLGAALVFATGVGGAIIAQRITRRITGDLPTGRVRDAVAAYESVRILGDALRAQSHEHGNRLHTAVALMELGRTPEAIEILTETSRESQALADLVATRPHGDPTVGALILGKAAQAKERKIDWRVSIDPAAPRSTLSAVDAVAVCGNLIDNALDAAASGEEPRWVSVTLEAADDGQTLVFAVSDSGPGIPAEVRAKIFERGLTTKRTDQVGRGVGLALARSIVENVGGSLGVTDYPTTFVAMLPARSSS